MSVRRGFTLIELLIVLTVGTALLMVAMSVLYALKETQSTVRQRLTDDRVAERLADQFREDAHAAQNVRLAASETPATRWRFACGPDRTVKYEIKGNEVQRVAMTGEKEVRETYRLRDGVTASVFGADTPGEIVALEFASPGPANARTTVTRIEAVLAFDNRYGTPPNRTANR